MDHHIRAYFIIACVLAVPALWLSACTADVTSGSFFSVRIGQERPGVVDGLQSMGVDTVRLVPRSTAIAADIDGAASSRRVDLSQDRRRPELLRTNDEACWEFDYNDRLGRRAVRLEFEQSILSRIHVRWYPPTWFLS